MTDVPNSAAPSNPSPELPHARAWLPFLAVLALAVALGVPAGLLEGWDAGLGVFTAVLALGPRSGRAGEHG
ncbi:hypothetical protein [Nocardia sp. NPDC057353]|uniref:hypothetical protein n=1 Tax=Nocardia sp. NPDC057353 TaxID=3346104 RepID=UPI003640BB3F